MSNVTATKKMLSVREDFRPLGGTTTIRKFDGKYLNSEVGDLWTVRHVISPDVGSEVLALEDVRVRAITIADLKTLAAAYGFETVQWGDQGVLNAAEKFYGKDNLGGNFIALSFD